METQIKYCEEAECFVNKLGEENERCILCKRNRENRDAQIKFPDNFMTAIQRGGY